MKREEKEMVAVAPIIEHLILLVKNEEIRSVLVHCHDQLEVLAETGELPPD